jgi:hypothetical protein
MDGELQAIHDIIDAAALPESVHHTANWCLGQLPELYREFVRTFDQRYADEIRRHARAIVHKLDGDLAEAAARHFLTLHERLGVPPLDLKPSLARPRKSA